MAPLCSGALSTQDNEDERTSSHVQSSNARGKSKASVPFSNTPPPPPPPITRQALDLQSAVANLLTDSPQRTNSSNDPGTSGLLAANTDLTGTHQQLPTTTNDPGIPVLPAAHTGESRCVATAMQLVFQPPYGNAYTGMLTFSGRLHIVFRIRTFHCTAHACMQHG